MTASDIPLPAGYRLSAHESVDSTNSEALRRADEGEEPGLWVWALSQTAGRGRLGRRWDSLAGNLFATLLLRPDCQPMRTAQLSLVAGLALHDAVTCLSGSDIAQHLALKWPNDLLYDGMKLGGILLESNIGNDGVPAVAMGIGLNLTAHPDTTDTPATDLLQHGISATQARALECLSGACEKWLGIWSNGEGFAHIRESWMARSLPINTPLQIKLVDSRLQGAYGGLTEDGALILVLNDGSEKQITTGDVFPL
ncbi:MAG: biotin--[acetyl-CoA-carboxylase] ligase [Methyloligellaceae bacterium]